MINSRLFLAFLFFFCFQVTSVFADENAATDLPKSAISSAKQKTVEPAVANRKKGAATVSGDSSTLTVKGFDPLHKPTRGTESRSWGQREGTSVNSKGVAVPLSNSRK